MEPRQLAQGLNDLLLYQERSLLHAPPYILKDIKIKEGKVPILGTSCALPSFWHAGQSRKWVHNGERWGRMGLSQQVLEIQGFLYSRSQLVPYSHQ